ncbi:T9SS type B sorting domain-containing protein [Muricauda sp. CAU 1633]|uniref:T9SS type B sorting domain-containing protein n=1 Tax=Allomuricauda sp. CAU 1633 TaxID=2816036 RepID=UPI001A8E05E3|nr:T9SS type B sorting domain-containing protein [Muricauda sp. CAU 1633]MBO0322013.1 T9SS type B sorting domain-containing protein [Muricauda sp. CAU 1633]
MKNRVFLLLLSLLLALGLKAQECPDLLAPTNGATNVPVDATISWETVDGVPAYNIILGTSPGDDDILASQFTNGSSFTPTLGLPSNTTIYVTITLFFFNSPNITCPSFSFTTEALTSSPNCTQMTSPMDLATDINPNTNISWDYVYGASGYVVRLGTTVGNNDILEQDVGNSLTLNPPTNLPTEADIFVTIIPYNGIGSATGCISQQFRTRAESEIPDCTTIVYPMDGETNVALSPILEWTAIPDATGYVVNIGTTPSNSDILNNSTFYNNSTPVLNFEPNKTFFITIVPFNDAGEAENCLQTSFSTLLGCGPYLDFDTGEYVIINPEIDFPETLSFCENESPLIVTSEDTADGYRWYQIDEFDNETVISDTNQVSIQENGRYRYEAYNLVSQSGNIIECPSIQEFTVVSSEAPIISRLDFSGNGTDQLQVTVVASGNGDYEYAVDNRDGPYSDNNTFPNLEPVTHTFYVRDKNGCGIAEKSLVQDLTVEGFPKFFTPNGDNINDYWQFIQPPNGEVIVLQSIQIFNRYGFFLKEILQNSNGWDGNFQGQPVPEGEYWFRAFDESNREIKGHFTLKR